MKRKHLKRTILILLAVCAVAAAVLILFGNRFGWWLPVKPMLPPMDKSNMQMVEAPEGAQLLLYPMDIGTITAGYQNPVYYEKNSYAHFGTDITVPSGQGNVLASGRGVVLGTEFCDNSLGNIVVIRYPDVYVPQTGETTSLIARYYHMTAIFLEKDDVVSAGQIIGVVDRSHKWYHHVHLELDTDLAYPFHTPQVAESSSALLNRFPADGSTIIDPISVLVAGEGQHIFVSPTSDCCEEKDNPRFLAP